MTPLQQINAMKKQIDTAQAVIAKITIPFNVINLLLEELKMEANAAGINLATVIPWPDMTWFAAGMLDTAMPIRIEQVSQNGIYYKLIELQTL